MLASHQVAYCLHRRHALGIQQQSQGGFDIGLRGCGGQMQDAYVVLVSALGQRLT